MSSQEKINTSQFNEDISVGAILDFLKQSWRWLLVGMSLGAFSALSILMIMPNQFEAKVLIQGGTFLGVELEAPTKLVERLKIPTFYGAEQLRACGIEDESSSLVLAQSINPVVLKGSNLIQLTFKATDSLLAVQCLESIVERLILSQSELSSPIIKNAKERLLHTQKNIAEIEGYLSALQKQGVGSSGAADQKLSNLALLPLVLLKTEDLQRLRNSALEQTVNLEAPATKPLQMLEPVYTQKVVLHKKVHVIAEGVFGGFLLGILTFFVRRSWLQRKLS